MRAEFDAIDRRESLVTFDEAAEIANRILRPLTTS